MNSEIAIKITNQIYNAYPMIDASIIRDKIEMILYDYDIHPVTRAIANLADIHETIELFLASKKLEGISKNTIANYKTTLIMFAAFVNKNVVDVETIDIRRFLALYSSKLKVKNSTLGNITLRIKAFFSWALDEGYISRNPSRQIKPIKVERKLRRSLTDEEIEKMRDSCKDDRERALLEFMVSSGCRLNEASQLNIGDINWMDRQARVMGKGNKERIIRFNERAKYHLRKYINSRKDARTDDPLFIGERKPYSRLCNKAVQNVFKRIVVRAGLPHSTCLHMTRHTTATKMINNGASLMTVQQTLGHSDPKTTMGYITQDKNTAKYEYDKYMS